MVRATSLQLAEPFHACRVVFIAGFGEGCFDLLRRRGNSKQLLYPSCDLGTFFISLLGRRRRRSLIDANNFRGDIGEGLSCSDLDRSDTAIGIG
jgi:hypothetical protein